MLRRTFVASLLSLAAILVWSPCAGAADGDILWGWYGVPVGGSCSWCAAAHTSDGYGGTIVAWADDAGGIWVQYIDASGAKHWLPSGRQLSVTGTHPSIFGDGYGGATIAWEDWSGIRVQRVDASGTALWTPGGVQVGTSGVFPVVVTDGWGGAFIVWNYPGVRCAHVDSYGTPSSPGVNGISLGGQQVYGDGSALRAIYDGTGGYSGPGGVIAVWADATENIVAQRVKGGLPWGSNPVYVSSDARSETGVRIAPAYPSGVLIAWAPFRDAPAQRQVRVQRLDLNGVAAWTAGGVVIVDTDAVGGHQNGWESPLVEAYVAPDGGGGAIVAWNDFRNDLYGVLDDDVYAQRVGDTGWPVWAVYGVRLPNPWGNGEAGSRRASWVVSDRLGGAIVVTQDSVGGTSDITANRVDADGKLHWSKTVFSDYGDPDADDQRKPMVLYDDSGFLPKGALVVWDDAAAGSVVAQKIEISPPANDVCAGAIAITPGTWSFSSVGSFQDGSASCGGGSDVWFQFTAYQSGTLVVHTCGTNDLGGVDQGMDTVLSLHSQCIGTPANELPGACNDDWSSSSVGRCGNDAGLARDSIVQASLNAGRTVIIRVARYAFGSNGPFQLSLSFAASGSGRTPDQSWPGTPLTLSKGPEEAITLSWGASCVATDSDYEVYEGHMGAWYDHYGKVCSTGGSTSTSLVPLASSTYYLVVPRNGGVEGSYGLNSKSSERPPSATNDCGVTQNVRGCP